jgi:uncharacterized coiled-coil DUF342 family protein
VEKTVILGMMEEIRMRARMLRQKLRESPQKVSEIIEKTKMLEEEMINCLSELSDCD